MAAKSGNWSGTAEAALLSLNDETEAFFIAPDPLVRFNRPQRALKDTKFFKGETKMKKMFALVLVLVL